MTPHDIEDIDKDEIERIDEDARRFPPGHPVHAALQRALSNTFSFWCLCDVTACRRAGRCVSDPTRCRDACLPLISEAVREAGLRIFDAQCEGLSFDEVLARWPDELLMLMAWTMRIENRRGAPRPCVADAKCLTIRR